MELIAIRRTLEDLLEVARNCVMTPRTIPGLVLIYTTIDIVANLERRPGEATGRKAFEQWTERYLLSQEVLSATSTDLYAARCGLLHAGSAGSHLMRRGKARPIVYAPPWESEQETEREARALGNTEDFVVLDAGSLLQALERAVEGYLGEIEADDDRRQVVEENATHWLFSTGERFPML